MVREFGPWSVSSFMMPRMADEPVRDNKLSTSCTPRVVLVVDGAGMSIYPEDGTTLVERWANVDPPNNPAIGAITKTSASLEFGPVV